MVVKKNQEVKDLNVLYKEAKKNSKAKKLEQVDPNTGEKLSFEEYETSQLLQVAENDQGDKIETYAVTKLAVESDTSKSDSGWDTTLGVKAASTIYLDKYYDSRGALYYDLISSNGTWSVYDSQYSLSNRKVTYGATGYSPFCSASGQNAVKYPTSDSFSYSAPSTWCASTGPVGVTMDVKITRGSSSWNFSFSNNMYST
ncbi:hypothetical protein BCE02nite_50510 [Brevibacillus centrosporus]|nr:hypothetical protein BCE02nite_50510 [Brevibacillus centrosporus]